MTTHTRPHGESHHWAKLTDHEVALLRQMRDETGWGYKRLAVIFEISKSHVRLVLLGKRRGCT